MSDVIRRDPLDLAGFEALPNGVKMWSGGSPVPLAAVPPRRKNGKCRKCGKQMPRVTVQVRKYAGPDMDREPFCSTGCAKAWFGTVANSTLKPGGTSGLHREDPPGPETRIQRFRRKRSEEARMVLEREGSHGWAREPGAKKQ